MHDLLLAGREIFVGLSTRTNMLGAQEVAKAFPEYPTTTVKVHAPAIHLKDSISMAGPEIMAVSKSEHAQKTFKVRILCNSARLQKISNLVVPSFALAVALCSRFLIFTRNLCIR